MARDLSEAFADFAAWSEGTLPLYAALAGAIADHLELLSIAETVPPGRSAPHLLFGGVHFLLLRGGKARLADYYPSVRADPRPPDEELLPSFRSFVRDHEADLRPILAERRT